MLDIRPKLHIHYRYPEGQVKTKLLYPDGTWKIEIFGSEDHMVIFAATHDMEIEDHAHDNGE